MKKIVGFFIAVALLSSLSACTPKRGVDLQPKSDLPLVSTPQSPFQLQLTSIENDGKTLRVEGMVSNKAAWTIDKVSNNLVGYKDGREVDSSIKPFKDFVNPLQLAPVAQLAPGVSGGGLSLPADSIVAFYLSIPSQNLSDYQVTLGWGNEAIIAQKPTVVWIESAIVDLGSIPDCNSNCAHFYAVEGSLQNQGSEVIKSVNVLLSFKGTESNLSEGQEVELSPLNIQPAGEQKVRLKFKNPIDPETGAKLKAEVKVLKVN